MTIDKDKLLLNRVKPFEVDYLYKYRTIGSRWLELVFSESKIWLSNPLAFNDPFDCMPKVVIHKNHYKREQFYKMLVKSRFPNYTKAQIKRELKNPVFRRISTHAYLDEIFKKFLKDFGIYCLSEVPDDILMWSHYSDSHKGICLQFKAKTDLTIFWEAYKVKYQDDYPEVNIMDLGNYDQFFNLFATKSNHWKYEQERRIIKTPDEGGSNTYHFEPDLLAGVILGAKITEREQQIVNEWISKSSTPINVYRAKINENSYKLDIPGVNC
ncbi:DUF2971 domain-containing protein [Desulfonatronum sp. SC1]|uniref:DUF2971 domain-containing protein n=1 Tax=Desulfonatronum sp. SC1 TaxID=2109626 RepID=UPI000D2FE970|nr:DUF2971 domain-containing protein [Desulfonatronum sp. SC1]PTN32677.1 hypothetical protein C6366_16060 [Desulfonatronum sp. SC1]